jgi:hypothetical protein
MRLHRLVYYSNRDERYVQFFLTAEAALKFARDSSIASFGLTKLYAPFELTQEGIEWLNSHT